MTDPITPLTPVVPLAGPRGSSPPAAKAAAASDAVPPSGPFVSPTPQADPAQPAAQSPVALSVDRDASGVFVYTLTDRGTGQVLAVIPRALATGVSGAPGGGVDIQA